MNAKEIIRCGAFIAQQIKKGYTPEEAFLQAEGSYSSEIVFKAAEAFQRALSNEVCHHCGAPMVDGMCDAPLSSAD